MGLRSVVRSHIIAWRKDMERRGLAPATIRCKLSALSSLFDYFCERNAVTGNPVDGVKRPMANGNEGSTPALGDAQARKLLEAPTADTLKGVRDRAILATLLYHGIRREELCGLRVKDLQSRQGVMHFRIKGKRDKIRFVPLNAAAQRLIEDYLALTGHRTDMQGALFRPVKNNRTGRLDRHLDPASVYRNIVRKYGNGHQRRGERHLCAFAAGHSGKERPLPRFRYRQGSGVAWACQVSGLPGDDEILRLSLGQQLG
jgi:integrase/recombinase XerD